MTDLTPDQIQRLSDAFIQRTDQSTDYQAYESAIRESGHADFADYPATHHQVMIDATLDLIHDRLPNGKRRLMLLAPPGSAKSTYASVRIATFFSAINPSASILACSNTQSLAEDFNRRRRNTIMTRQWQRISGTSIDPQNQGVEMFSNLAGGRMRAAGVGASIVGFRSDFNVLDDPVSSSEQANSLTQMEKSWQWYKKEYRTRLKPNCPELLIMQRWSANDIAGHLLDTEGGSWHVIRLPMLCDDPQNDPLNRHQDEPLWPEWYSDQQLKDAQANPHDWSSLYQQRPLDERGEWVPPQHVHLVTQRPSTSVTIGALDIALSLSKGDFSVISIADFDHQRALTMHDMFRGRVGPDTLCARLFEMNEHHTPTTFLMDDDNTSRMFQRVIQEKTLSLNIQQPPIYLMPMRGQDKETRAAAFRAIALNDKFFLLQRPWNAPVIQEINAFPSLTAPDDIIDTLGLMGRYAAQLYAPKPKEKPQFDKIWGAVQTQQDGSLTTVNTLDELYDDPLHVDY